MHLQQKKKRRHFDSRVREMKPKPPPPPEEPNGSDWVECWTDENGSEKYYWNWKSSTTSWEIPETIRKQLKWVLIPKTKKPGFAACARIVERP